MEKHPVESVMDTTLAHIKDMVDVNTVIGNPIYSENGVLILPLSKVGFGFAAGGTQFGQKDTIGEELPFGGGAGAGVSVNPCGFLVINAGKPTYLPVQCNDTLDKVLNSLPELMEEVKTVIKSCINCENCNENQED